MGILTYSTAEVQALLDAVPLKAPAIEDGASGSVVQISDGLADAPIKSLEVDIPSGSSVSTVTVRRLGKNWFVRNTSVVASHGYSRSNNDDGSLLISGTSDGTDATFNLGSCTLPAGTYRLTGCPSGGGSSTYRMRANKNSFTGTSIGYDSGNGLIFTLTETTNVYIRLIVYSGTYTDLRFEPMIRLSSETDASFVGNLGDTYTIALGQTVTTGGALEVISGKLTVDGMEYSVTAQEINTLGGVNNIWADAGDCTVDYYCDTKAYIDRLIASLT